MQNPFKKLGTNCSQVLICYLGGICCFIPLFFSSITNFSDSPLRIAVTSLRSRDSAGASMALTLPIFIEAFTEMILANRVTSKSKKIQTHLKQALLNTRERLLLAAGVTTIPLTAFLHPDTPNLVNLYLCLRKCRILLIFGAVIISLCRYDRKCFTVKKTYITLTFFVLSTVLGSFYTNFRTAHEMIYQHISATLFMAGISTCLFGALQWLRQTVPNILRGILYSRGRSHETLEDQNPGGTIHLVFPLLYILCTVIIGIAAIVMSRIDPIIEVYNGDALFYDNLAFTLHLFLATYISEKMMKFEVVKGLYALIESKKMYVRYISHELRTPLNSAFLGLKLVCDDFKVCSEIKMAEHLETLVDVRSACRIAVEILNDLLCFDKLESGILELHKHDVPVMPFIAECVNMFATQAREGGVAISNVTSDASYMPYKDSKDFSISTSLLEGDTVAMDKFKMDQVLRNLISNALKFTPRGGSVTVCASFVPNNDEVNIPPSELPPCAPEIIVVPTVWSTLQAHWLYVTRFLSSEGLRKVIPSPATSPQLMPAVTNDIESAVGHSAELPEFCGDDVDPLPRRSTRRDSKRPFKGSSTRGIRTAELQDIDEEDFRRCSTESLNPNRSASHDAQTRTISGKLRIVVSDTGAGISDINQQRLFKEIVQFSPEVLQAGGGSGLGLWITNSIVQLHAGTIHAFSPGPGRGSTFTVEIDMQRKRFTGPDTVTGILSQYPGLEETCILNHTEGPLTSKSGPRTVRWNTPDDPQGCRNAFTQGTSQDPDPTLKTKYHDLEAQTADITHIETLGSPISLFQPNDLGNMTKPTSTLEAVQHPNPDPKPEPDPSEAYDVLVVDDSSLNRKLLSKLLRNSGYTCEEAYDGFAAVEKVRLRMARGEGKTTTYDAILMDFVMPNMDGPTATKIIRGLGYTKPIFGVTGNALDSDIKHFISRGVNCVLIKPFNLLRFQQVMREMRESQAHDLVVPTANQVLNNIVSI